MHPPGRSRPNCGVRKRATLPTSSSNRARCIRWPGMLLACLVCAWPPGLLAAAKTTVVDRGESGLWAGGVLILLGLVGVLAAMFFIQRRQLKAARDDLEAQVVALKSQRGVLETWLENQRLSGEHRQEELEAEIGRQRQAVAALRVSEHKFRNINQQLPVGVFLVDTEGRCQYVNERWCQKIGRAHV